MGALFRFIRSRWFLTFSGVVPLALLVWWFGPFLSVLEGRITRSIVIVLLFLVWAGWNVWLDRRRKKNDNALISGATATSTEDATAAATAEEVAAMKEKLTSALTLLKRASGNRGYLYEQPWYAIIGPPGAGKTTALLNAGLTFPLAAEMGQQAVAGVGGTRMCDWWFTENAVLIDTAGRYTTQDSDAAVDKAGWDAFLGLLKRTRSRQPLNGVLVATAISDIAAAPQHERLAHARAIRRRVKELSDKLGLRLPVYALFTKADLIAGFMEFYDDLDRERRGQVWGMTFPLNSAESGVSDAFSVEFAQLVQRLNERLIDRLQSERSPDRRTAIAGFPAQVASLTQPLEEFIREAFGGSRLDPAPLLRGVYLTSGTQEGSPIDRLTGAMARSFGIDQQRAPSLRPEQGRSYFLTRLLKDVVFGEATLGSRDPVAVKRNRLAYFGVTAAAGLIALLGAAALIQTRTINTNAVAASNAALAAYTQKAQSLALDPVGDDNLPAIVPVLNAARALPHGVDAPAAPRQWFPGLDQTAKLGAGARQVYTSALDHILLPRLIRRLETQMRQRFDDPNFLYGATRVYLMLGSQGPLDRDTVKAWMHYDWQAAYPGPANDAMRTALETHLAYLLDQPLPQMSLDGALVEDARRTFSRVPLAQRVYGLIMQSAAATALPMWRPSDAVGVTGVHLFVRHPPRQMTDGIPGLFTVNGFYKVLLPSLPDATTRVASESWVLGEHLQIDPNSPQVRNLQSDVVQLYEAEYIKQWDALLNDLEVQPLTDLSQAAQTLYILSSPQSPMRDLLVGITRQLALNVPPPSPGGSAGTTGAAKPENASKPAFGSTDESVKNLFGQGAGAPSAPPGTAVANHFKALIDFVGQGPGTPIDNVLRLLNNLQQQLATVANAPQGATVPPPTGAEPSQLLLDEALQSPQPVQRWMRTLATSGTTQSNRAAQKAAAGAFNAPGGAADLCRQAVNDRYPFFAGSANDIPLADFSRLFAPHAMLDQYFNQQLRPYVDTSGAVWKAQSVGGMAPPLSAAALAQFQRAAAIRDLFFSGGAQPNVSFDIIPDTLDPGARQVTLELGSATVTYAHGPQQSTSVTWPGTGGGNSARLVFDPPPAGGTGVLQTTGPWALFRLFNMGTVQAAGSSDRYTLTFRLGDREAGFEIRAASVLNPFAPGVLREFRCPAMK